MTIQPVNFDIIIYQGGLLDEQYRLESDDNGTAFDLTGYTAKMQARETPYSPTAFLELSTANGAIILGGTAGTIRIQMLSAETKLITSGGVYSLELTNSANEVFTLLLGKIILSPEITQ